MVGGERDNRGWDDWMASPTQWTWVWMNSGSWWWTGRPSVLELMASQRVGHEWATKLNFHSLVVKDYAFSAGDPGSIPGLGRSPGEGNGNPLQYYCLENPMDRGAWLATVHGVPRVRHDLATKPDQTTILAWKIPWTDEPGGLQSMVVTRVRQDYWLNNNKYMVFSWLPETIKAFSTCSLSY